VIPFAGDIVTQDIKHECQVLRSQAEKLKVRFGCAIAQETQEYEVITIPGIAGRDKKEISMRTLANIIQSRMEEIFAAVNFEIRNSGLQNNLIGGIVVTGGGSQMMHLKQLVEYVTGYSARIGYPTEHIAKGTKDELKNPMYATGLGLILKGYEALAEDEENRANKKKAPQVVIEEKQPEPIQIPTQEKPKEKLVLNGKGEKWWTKLNKDIKEWFADTDVNKDFE
jgi:cell division protein FtsA